MILFLINWTSRHIRIWKYMNMIMCNILACMWMNDTIRTLKYYLIIEQTQEKYRLWLLHKFYEYACVCNICIYKLVCISMRRKEPDGSLWWGKMRYFVCYICWHVNTCWRKEPCESQWWGKTEYYAYIYCDMWIYFFLEEEVMWKPVAEEDEILFYILYFRRKESSGRHWHTIKECDYGMCTF